MPPENRFVLPTYWRRAEFGDLLQIENRELMADRIVSSARFEYLGLEPEKIRARIVAEGATVGTAVGIVLRAFADRFGKVRWGDKRPAYRHSMRVLQRMFPTAQFIHPIRDGRDCVASMLDLEDGTWDNATAQQCMLAWMEAIEFGERARQRLPSDTFLDFRYEDLVRDPETTLRTMCDFLGEDFDPRMLHPETVSTQIVTAEETWHARTRTAISTASIGTYSEKLSKETLALCEAVMGERLERLGYVLEDVGPACPEAVEEYDRAARHQARRIRRRNARDRQVEELQPVRDMSLEEAKLHRRTEKLRSQNARLRDQNARLRERLGQVAAARDQALQERSRLQRRLDAITSSTSWAVRRPLRALRRFTFPRSAPRR